MNCASDAAPIPRNVEAFVDAFIAFVTLLLLPLLGLLGLLKRRALPWLVAALVGWVLLGAWAVRNPRFAEFPRERMIHGYWVGIALGSAFLLIAWLHARRRVARWVKLALAALTLVVFVRAVWMFLESYA